MSTEHSAPEGADGDLATENERLRKENKRLQSVLAEVSDAADITIGLLGDVKSRDQLLRWIIDRIKRA